MFGIILVPLVLAAATTVSAGAVRRHVRPAGWDNESLENYWAYHARYLALGCPNKHQSPFFDQCCHPLLATEKLEFSRPEHCIPAGPATTAPSTAATTSDPVGDHDQCDEEEDESDSSPDKSPPETTSAPLRMTIKRSAASPILDLPTDKSVLVAAAAPLNRGGYATYYYQNGNAGACGRFHSDRDLIAAIDYRRYGNLSRQSSLCGRLVEITNPANGRRVTVKIEDACPSCINSNSIDLSVEAFKQIATQAQGQVTIEWRFI